MKCEKIKTECKIVRMDWEKKMSALKIYVNNLHKARKEGQMQEDSVAFIFKNVPLFTSQGVRQRMATVCLCVFERERMTKEGKNIKTQE